jgi:subtilisin family serine protease
MTTRLLNALAIGLSALVLAATSAPAAEVSASTPTVTESQRYVLVLLDLAPQHLRAGGGYGDGYGDGISQRHRRKIADGLARQHGLTVVEGWPMPLVGVDCFVMAVPDDQSPEKVAQLLSKAKGVAWSEPVSTFHAQSQADSDPLFRAQPAARAWRLNDLHQMATGRSVRVAVVDSMVDVGHPDLAGQVELSQNFLPNRPMVPEQHGTGIAGVIAARANNQQGIVGVAPGARLLALRACWEQAGASGHGPVTLCDSLGLAKAINFAIVNNAQVINLSLSGPTDPLLSRLIDVAVSRGVVVVGAYDRKLPGGGFPANHAGVVAGVDGAPGVPIAGILAAPGRDIPTTQTGGHWFFVNGSSYSAAHVSGLFALMKEISPHARASSGQVEMRSGGEIDVCATLLRATGPRDCACSRAIAASH